MERPQAYPSLLQGLCAIGRLGAKAEGVSPSELLTMTLPIPAHGQALEPDILLVLGGRGAGKSHLFRVVNLPEGPRALGSRGAASGATWLRGFSVHAAEHATVRFPGDTALERFCDGRTRTDLVDFWRGLLAGVLLGHESRWGTQLGNALPEGLATSLRDLSRVSTWHAQVARSVEELDAALQRIDDALDAAGHYLFVTYDDLDVMAVEWEAKRALIRALLQFWLGHWRRWRRIRPKVFLRRDLFSSEFLDFPDASKLEGHKLDLRWTPQQLYHLVFKLWANQRNECREFLEGEGSLRFDHDPVLGWMYAERPPGGEQLKGVIHHMVGEFMGGSPKKGRTFEWIPNHLQDARGEIFPRSVLTLFARAAEDELEFHRTARTLLSPLSLGAAIEQVSEHRIRELEEEYPWLSALRSGLCGQQVPMQRSLLTSLIADVDWSQVDRKPDTFDAEKLIGHMLQIGILRETTDRRIHVPDIYLYGFGLKRKGGIRRPR